jgi:hypothetical protein
MIRLTIEGDIQSWLIFLTILRMLYLQGGGIGLCRPHSFFGLSVRLRLLLRQPP